MRRYHSYIDTTKEILSTYQREETFPIFLKKFFSASKKFGSTDRKLITHLCYCFYRLGKALPERSLQERILIGLFLCSTSSNEILQELKPEWNEKVSASFEEKMELIPVLLSTLTVFPWKNELSEKVDHLGFTKAYFIQPDLFLRLRPGFGKAISEKLRKGKIDFRVVSEHCLALPNASKLDKLIELDKEAVVQDLNSQRIKEFFPVDLPAMVWDCCAGSGGKSILIHDTKPKTELIVSDLRKSILINLIGRFRKAGITNYRALQADLSKPDPSLQLAPFNFIMADVPCTGSGTWSRNPEQLHFFDEKRVERYSNLQQQIVGNVIPYLAEGGHLLYVTCSVFRKENEEMVQFIKSNFDMEVVKTELLEGYNKKADTMFAALMKKKS